VSAIHKISGRLSIALYHHVPLEVYCVQLIESAKMRLRISKKVRPQIVFYRKEISDFFRGK
jgi:hypothetical protein